MSFGGNSNVDIIAVGSKERYNACSQCRDQFLSTSILEYYGWGLKSCNYVCFSLSCALVLQCMCGYSIVEDGVISNLVATVLSEDYALAQVLPRWNFDPILSETVA
jgi:hypothetical protein